MAKKVWTEEDREGALKWLSGKGVVMLKDHLKSADDFLSDIRSIRDPEEFGETVSDALTDEWLRKMLTAIRQRKFSAKKPEKPATASGPCESCEKLKEELKLLTIDNDMLRLCNLMDKDALDKGIKDLARLDDENNRLNIEIAKLKQSSPPAPAKTTRKRKTSPNP